MAQAPKTVPSAKTEAPTAAPAEVKLEGGAAEVTASASAIVDDAGGDGIDVITFAPGTINDRGIVPIGTRFSVKPEQFSRAWMKPTTKEGAAKARAVDKAREDEREAKVEAAAKRTALELARQLGIGAT